MNMLGKFIHKLANKDLNKHHPDFENIDEAGAEHGLDAFTSRRAFFAAREIQTLHESEILDGGDGKEAMRANPLDFLMKIKKK